jgi:endo-1,4-beta-xylanase
MQGHFDELLTGIPAILEILDRFAEFDLPIQITEFDVSIRDEEVQAKYLEDFYTAVFSHPATEKIVMWGYYEKVMWKPLAALVREDWTYKPNYHAYMDLVYDKWWTNDTTGTTNTEGIFNIRGFKGSYDITVSVKDSLYLFKDVLIEEDLNLQLKVMN